MTPTCKGFLFGSLIGYTSMRNMSKGSHNDKDCSLYVSQNKENTCIFKVIAICFINISDSHVSLTVEYSILFSEVESVNSEFSNSYSLL